MKDYKQMGEVKKMRRAFLYASIGLTILMLFTANSVVAAGWAEDWDKAWTVATQPQNILGPPDNNVTSLGIPTNYTGIIYIIMNSTFQLGPGDDFIVYGLDVDSTSEQYVISYGIWAMRPYIVVTAGGVAYDSDGVVSFDLGISAVTFNMIVLFALSGTGGAWPGPEIDAVYALHP